jgi:hypothetical protein
MPHTHLIHKNSPLTQRHDPITGDAFAEGDRVVFCASCQSAFLVDSWKYMGKKHCGQSRTLKNVPEVKPLMLGLNAENTQSKIKEDIILFTFPKVKPNRSVLPRRYLYLKVLLKLPYLVWGTVLYFLLSYVIQENIPTSKLMGPGCVILCLSLALVIRLLNLEKNVIQPKLVYPIPDSVDNLGFYLGAKYLHLIKPRRKKAYYFGGLRSREELDFASYNYSDFKALHFKCTRKDRDMCLTLVTDSKEAKKVVSEVHFAENSGFLALACRAFSHLSEDVALHYYPSDEENRALMKKLMGLYKSKVILH